MKPFNLQRITIEAAEAEPEPDRLFGPSYDARQRALKARGSVAAEWTHERCPKCGATLVTNGRAIWCSFVGGAHEKACDYGIAEQVTTVQRAKSTCDGA